MLKDMTQAARRARATELSFLITSCEKMIFHHVERYDTSSEEGEGDGTIVYDNFM